MTSKKMTRRSGVAAVELAVVMPLMLTLLMGAWEVGRMAEAQQILTNGVREGGRLASTGNSDAAAVQTAVVNYIKANGISNVTTAMVTVTNITNAARSDPTTATQLDQFRVTITVPVDNVRWVLLTRITSGTNLTASADWYSMNDVPLTVNATIPLN